MMLNLLMTGAKTIKFQSIYKANFCIGPAFNLYLSNFPVGTVVGRKFLGISVDEKLFFWHHIGQKCKNPAFFNFDLLFGRTFDSSIDKILHNLRQTVIYLRFIYIRSSLFIFIW